jgi:hypothetical protein
MLLASEIGDVKRFPSAKKLVSYAGLAPGTRQSADKTVHGHIVKEGNKRIRWILVEAAQHASRHDPKLRGLYLRIMKRRGYQQAIVAVARKMFIAMCHELPEKALGMEASSQPTGHIRDPTVHMQSNTIKREEPSENFHWCKMIKPCAWGNTSAN